MKSVSLILVFLGVFLLPTAVMSAITDDACAPGTDTSITLDSNTTSYINTLPLPDGSTHSYYFYIATPGTVNITLTNTANKVIMNYSQSTCPIPGGTDDPITVSSTESFDFNLLLTSTGVNAGYTLTVTFTPTPLAITKTAYPAQVAENTDTNVTYTILVTNNTGSAINNLTLTDTLPAGVTLLPPIGVPSGWDCNGSSEITCTAVSIPSKGDAVFTMDVNVNSSSDVINTAEVEAEGEEKVSSSSIIRAVSGSKEVDLEIQKHAEAYIIPPNTAFSYLFFVVNHSQSADAELVTITDTFPEDDITITGYDSSTGWTCTIPPPEGSDTFTCDFNRSLGHEITYFTVQATTGDEFEDHVINTATVDALNPISGGHDITDFADINISDANITGGTLGGKYVKGGSIEISDNLLPVPGTHRTNARIHTKVASTESMTLPVQFVDYTTNLTASYVSGQDKTIPVTVLLKLTDDDCTVASETPLSYDGSPVAAFFDEGDSIKNAGSDPQAENLEGETFTMRNIGQRKSRIIMKYVDINEKLDYSGETCSVSNLSSNIKGLPQCIANSGGATAFDNNKYINVFGIEAFIRCNINNGQPCNSLNNGAGDEPYDHAYGCYECTVGGAGYCSNDNFAIRPKAFDVNITDGDVYKAGKGYSLSYKGKTANTTITDETTLDYNETQILPGSIPVLETETFSIDANVTNNDNCQIKYLTNDPLVKFQDGLDNGPFKFDDIGNINFSMHETVGTEFAKVDENDTDIAQRLIEDFNVTFTVIPDHFDITATLTDHNGPNNLTYLHDTNRYDDEDNYTMAANLTIDINATGEDGNITSNYTEGCYAKSTKLTLGLNGTDIIYPGSTPALTKFLYYNPVEDDGSIDSGEESYTLPAPVGNTISLPTLPIDNIASSFPENAPDGNGTTHENGTTHIEYKLNFDRKMHLAVNPVNMALSDVNIIEIDSTITNSDHLVEGNTGTLTNQNAYFYYARTRASKFFYEDIDDTNVVTPILVDLYCDLSFTACTNLGIDTIDAQINEINWWLSLGHRDSNNDGNITLEINLPGAITEGEDTDTPTVDTDVNVNSQAQDPTITVTSYASVLPMTVEIDLDEDTALTNRWLIYNEDTDDNVQEYPSPLYKVRFIGTSGWAGHGKTGHVVDSNVSTKKHRRLGW